MPNVSLIYGARIESRERRRMVTKYNEDTGEPYQKQIGEIIHLFEGTEVEVDPCVEQGEPLSIFYNYGYDDHIILGIEVCEVDEHNSCIEIPSEIEGRDAADFALMKAGFTGEPKLYLLNGESAE